MPLADGFDAIAAALPAMAREGEIVTAWVEAERSDFVRFNRGRVRQAGSVERCTVQVRLLARGRSASIVFTLPRPGDTGSLRDAIAALREVVAGAPPDPWSEPPGPLVQARTVEPGAAAPAEAIVDDVVRAADGADLVGFAASGPVLRGFASSLGHALVHETGRASLELSVYAPGALHEPALRDKAARLTWSGPTWDAPAVAARIAAARERAGILVRPVRRLEPGAVRMLFAPRATAELIGMLGWGGFSARAHLTGQSPLAALRAGTAAFAPMVSLHDAPGAHGVPRFGPEGMLRPAEHALVCAGAHAGWLACPRTAREFGIGHDGADASESPSALAMAPGALPEDDALAALDTGVWVSNLWYLNWSDRHACRMTGMTRFACLWVERGVPVAPIAAARLDDSLYRVLGSELEALGDRAPWLADTDTYDARAVGGVAAPMALVRAVRVVG